MQQELYHNILSQIQNFYTHFYKKPKAGRKPKVQLPEIVTLFILSYVTNSPVLTLAKMFINPNIRSYHIFRSYRLSQVYLFLRDFMLWKIIITVILKSIAGKKKKLIIDGTILPVANVNRARTQRIKK